jgi:diketogulonate reductase-like aldo/keto reductase
VRSRREILRLGAAATGLLLMGGPARGQARLERAIPQTGERLPAVGLGTWQVFDVAGDARELGQARETLRELVAGGGRVIDSSPMYGGSETVTGQLAAELGVQGKLFVATKVWTSGKQAGIRQMEDSMRKLRVERLDLMQVHTWSTCRRTWPRWRSGRRRGACATWASRTTTRAATRSWSGWCAAAGSTSSR